MSYGSAPPPRTPYGDQDFVKEDLNPQPRFQPQSMNRNFDGTNPNAPYGAPTTQPPLSQLPSGQAAPPALGTNSSFMPANTQDLATKIQSLTPEDRVFLRSWRQDSFYYRVLPISALGCGALYYYNHLKNLPNSVGRYLVVVMAGYSLGKYSYKGELVRRLEMTPLNTPFIQGLREVTGVKPALSSMGEFSGDTSQDFNAAWNAGESAYPASGAPGSFSQLPHTAYGQYNSGPQDLNSSYYPDSSTSAREPPKSFTSYEELRAKNRGLLQK